MPLLKFSSGRLLPAFDETLQEVTLEDWRANPQSHAGATALVISNDASLNDLRKDIDGFDHVILHFPSFTDGRAYSQARLLRDRFEYSGEIRARGEVLPDQIFFMFRCGIDAFEVDELPVAQDILRIFSFAYQRAADSLVPAWQQRGQRAVAA